MELSLGSKCALGTYYMLICLGGLFGNILVILAIAAKEVCRKRQSNIYLITLAIADLLTSLIVVPYFMFGLDLPALEPSHKMKYRLPCRFAIFFVYLCGVQRILSLTIMSMDRYAAILHPFWYERCLQGNTVLILNCYTVVQTIATNLPLLIMPGWVGYDGKASAPCGFVWKGKLGFLIAYLLLNFLLPFLILLVTNISVFVIARKQRRRILNLQQNNLNLQIDSCSSREFCTTASPEIRGKRLNHGFSGRKSPVLLSKNVVFPEAAKVIITTVDNVDTRESTRACVNEEEPSSKQASVNDADRSNRNSLNASLHKGFSTKSNRQAGKDQEEVPAYSELDETAQSDIGNGGPKCMDLSNASTNQTTRQSVFDKKDEFTNNKTAVSLTQSNGVRNSIESGDPGGIRENLTQLTQNKRLRHLRRRSFQDITIALSTVMLVVVFVVAWLPFAASRTVFIIDRKLFSWTVVAVSSSMTLLSAVCNPFIVIVTRKDLRKSSREVLAPCLKVCLKTRTS